MVCTAFPFESRFQEARAFLLRKQIRTSRGSKTVSLTKEKKKEKTHFFRFQVTRPCLSQKQNRASHETKKKPSGTAVPLAKEKKQKIVFFSFPRSTAVLPTKAKSYLLRRQNCASNEKNREHVFFVFERYDRASHGWKTAPLTGKTLFSREKKNIKKNCQKLRKTDENQKVENPEKTI